MSELVEDQINQIRNYLGSGRIKGVRIATAEKLINQLGTGVITKLKENPLLVHGVRGIAGRTRTAIEQHFKDWNEMESDELELISKGLSASQAAQLRTKWGKDALRRITDDPYSVMSLDGFGFKRADELAHAMGKVDPAKRTQAAIKDVLQRSRNEGHTYIPRPEVERRAEELLGQVAKGWEIGLPKNIYATPTDVGFSYLRDAEAEVADRLKKLGSNAARRPISERDISAAIRWLELKFTFSPEQLDVLRATCTSPVNVITGGPGTGKTTLVRGILAVAKISNQEVSLATPTGRASRRLTEVTGVQASTIHRLLGYNEQKKEVMHNANYPLDIDWLIIDEVSMVDIELMRHVLRALKPQTRLLLVGDADQLPSVGPGNVLLDIIRSQKVKTHRLNRIYRQDAGSSISHAAHSIIHGEVPRVEAEPGYGYHHVFVDSAEVAARTAEIIVTQRIPQRFELSPTTDVQVLTPGHKGFSGTRELNSKLQNKLIPSGPSVYSGGEVFRVGSRIMCTKNDYYRDVYNGDVGFVTDLDSETRYLAANFNGKQVEYNGNLSSLTLAYACSTHKSQGSEYPAVVILLTNEHWIMLRRNLFYTAVTRAQKLCVVICQRKALSQAVHEFRCEPRYSRLQELLAA